MPKKIYDIVPPKAKMGNAIKTLDGKNKVRKTRKKPISDFPVPQPIMQPVVPPIAQYGKKRFPLREVLAGGAIITFLFGIYLYNKLPKADVEIWPKMDTLTFQEKITADASVDLVNLDDKVIPAQYLEEQIDGNQEFPTTGIASNDGKASGIIKIYNKLNPAAPFTLIKGTHFLSDSGKYFITLGKITIPAAHYEKGKLVPGSVDAKVEAKEVGENNNIGASNFSVPKLSGTSYYYNIYAESKDAMAGGYTGSVKKATKDDIQQAKDAVTKKLLSQAEDSLKGKLSLEDVLLDNAILRDVINVSADAKEGAVIDKFNVSAKVKISALVFKKQDLEKLAKDYILSQLSDDQNFWEKSLDLGYNPEAVDVRGGSAKLDLKLSAKTYQSINTNDLIDFLSTKSAYQIKETVGRMYNDSVSDTKVDFWPFWVKKSPKDKNRIRIDLLFE